MRTLTTGITGIATSIVAEETLTQINSVTTIAIQLIIAIITLVKLFKSKDNEKN